MASADQLVEQRVDCFAGRVATVEPRVLVLSERVTVKMPLVPLRFLLPLPAWLAPEGR